MPAAVVAIISVAASVGGAVAAVAATVASVIGAVIGPVMAAVSGIVSGIAAALGTTLAPLINVIGSIANYVVTGLGQTLQGVVGTLKATVGPVIQGLSNAIVGIVKAITEPLAPILNPLKDGLSAINTQLKAIDVAVTTALGPVAEAVKLIITASNVKLLYDMITGHASIMQVIQKISEDTQLGTMQAVAELSKQIITTSVGVMDKVDTQFELLSAAVDTFDERIVASATQLKEELNAEIAATITPRLDTLGRASSAMNRQIATLYRRMEDKGWFAAMMVKIMFGR